MSRKGNAIGNRLGFNKDWISQFSYFKYAENIKNFLFLNKILAYFLEKLSIWFLDIRIIQKKNILHIYILISYLNSKLPIIKNVFLTTDLQINWYWEACSTEYFRVPRPPASPLRKHTKINTFYKKLFKRLGFRARLYRITFLQYLSFYLEKQIYIYFKYPIKIYFYNIIDSYSIMNPNNISSYIAIFLNLYRNDQKALMDGIKTAVFYICIGILKQNSFLIAKTFSIEIRRHKHVGQLFKFFFKIIRELFNIIPLYNKKGQKQRAEYLKIQISGKINGEMRAIKKIYSFNQYKGKELPIQTLNYNISYSLEHSITFAGVLGIKVWLF